MQQLKVALQHAILTRCAVYCDVGIIEDYGLSVMNEREIVLVDSCRCAVLQVNMPVQALHIDDIYVITFLVEERVQSLR